MTLLKVTMYADGLAEVTGAFDALVGRAGGGICEEGKYIEQYSHEANIAVARSWLHVFDLRMTDQRRIALERKHKVGYDALGVMEKHLKDNDFFVGDYYSIADIALYSYTHVAGEGGFDLEGFPAVRAWLKRVSSQHADNAGLNGSRRSQYADRTTQLTPFLYARCDPGPAGSVRPGRRAQRGSD